VLLLLPVCATHEDHLRASFCRQEGIYATAKAIEARIQQLIASRSSDSSRDVVGELQSTLSSFQVRQQLLSTAEALHHLLLVM
jgi:hypothetical protein